MDTKLKNNHKLRIRLSVLGVLMVVIATMCFFPAIHQAAEESLKQQQEEATADLTINEDLLRRMYEGTYALYMEKCMETDYQSASKLFLEVEYSGAEQEMLAEDLDNYVNSLMFAARGNFEAYRAELDYCMELDDNSYDTSTSQPLHLLFGNISKEDENRLIEYYSAYFMMEYDANGKFSITPLYSGNVNPDSLIKTLGQFEREKTIWQGAEAEYQEQGLGCKLKGPENFRVIFGLPRDSNYQLVQSDYEYGGDYWTQIRAYREAGGEVLYVAALAVLAGLVFLMTSNKLWKEEINFNRPGRWYLLEAAWTGVISVLCLVESFIGMIFGYDNTIDYANLAQRLKSGDAIAAILDVLSLVCALGFIFGTWYLSIWFIRPMFALGLMEYIRQYSFFYQILPLLRSIKNKLMDEAKHIDFSEKSVRTVIKLLVANFVIMSVCAMFWVPGIFLLAGYSVILFFLIERYYKGARKNYQMLREGVARIAEGDLDSEIADDIGMFEPIKEELGKVRVGFKKAVDEEVKSQRMKTELITNVSHDLKTPLTAITTYVELLKKEDITEEERKAYIETLERKSLRLKVLIEDLFEVSKASSNNISLEYIDVDVVKLLKQVSIEHTDKFEQNGMDLRWNVPTEKVILQLDNQKTYRVFENLFVNIQKYAMPHSRVYIDVTQDERNVIITLKNMSATELNISADEITERFVRGDSSRNTEGSGLGLAIAKSFTEAQGGNFKVEVDGDLFKVVIVFGNARKNVVTMLENMI